MTITESGKVIDYDLALGYQASKKFLKYDIGRCLDIGSGDERIFRDHPNVKTCDLKPPADYVGDYLSIEFPEPFDSIWCCHVLEHQRNPGLFLEKIRRDVKLGGLVAITVPPYRTELVGGHIHLGNAGHLLYNMILAGFDCSKARVGVYSYNISVIVKMADAELPRLSMDVGDIEKLQRFFPFEVYQGMDGDFDSYNW